VFRQYVCVVACLCLAARAAAQDPFADEIVSFAPGTDAGFGQDQLPGIVLGPPFGGGPGMGSLDVVSLGNGGEIVLRFDEPVICDADGADFTVFENAFRSAGGTGPVFAEVGIVAVSQDGIDFFEFPFDPDTYEGLAGKTPVYSAPDNGIDPADPAVSGGDSFDLAGVGLAWAAYVRIVDPGAAIPDPGNLIPPGIVGGFDLDAIVAIHACAPNPATATPTRTATATPEPTSSPASPTTTPPITHGSETPTPVVTATPTSSGATRTATETPGTVTATETLPPSPTAAPVVVGDVDGNGVVDRHDRSQLAQELFDGDGDRVAEVENGDIASTAGADTNLDGRVTAADLVGIAAPPSP
jgi:hypothetical protein